MAIIAIFIPSLAGGGAERVAVTLANEFAKTGHDSHLVVATTESGKYDDEINDLVSAHRLGASRTITSILKFSSFIRKYQPDVILSVMGHTSVVAKLSAILSGQNKTRLYIREAISPEWKQHISSGLLDYITNALIHRTYSGASGIISPSRDLAISLLKNYPLQNNIRHINNPVVTDTFNRQAEEQSVSTPWATGTRYIVSAGRLSEQKDFLTLLKAFKLVRNRLDYKLVILGDGPDRQTLEKFIDTNNLTEHCYLPGFVSNPLPYFRQSELFVLSSRHEGLPNTLIQALACGTKAVATDCPTGPAEILNDGQFGILVPVGDFEKMAAAIETALGLTDRNAQNLVIQSIHRTFNASAIASEFLDFMLEANS